MVLWDLGGRVHADHCFLVEARNAAELADALDEVAAAAELSAELRVKTLRVWEVFVAAHDGGVAVRVMPPLGDGGLVVPLTCYGARKVAALLRVAVRAVNPTTREGCRG